ncbi:MAG: hypothetical protein D6735_10610 [Acidobacteria bacterium]|nr:MAG: hypothetical protein D6735_10610 [Acidobacteriota bacterium]
MEFKMKTLNLLLDVCEFNLKLNPTETNRLIPWLMGVTGSGKTHSIRKIAKELNLPLEHIILQGISELEFLGIPSHQNGKTIWGLPEWYSPTPKLYFFDEVDKAHPEILSVILTLVSDYSFRNHYLHPESLIIFASQPIEPAMFEGVGNPIVETLKALRSRSFIIPFHPSEVLGILFPKTFKIIEPLMENNWQPPIPDTISIRQLKWLKEYTISLIIKNGEMQKEELLSLLTPIASGITTNYLVVMNAILEELKEETVSITDAVVKESQKVQLWEIPQDELIVAATDLINRYADGENEMNLEQITFLTKVFTYLRGVMAGEEINKHFPQLADTKTFTIEHNFNSHAELFAHLMQESVKVYKDMLLNDDILAIIINDPDKIVVNNITTEKKEELRKELEKFASEVAKNVVEMLAE